MSIKSYKGFDKDLKCRGFQYEVGKTYEMPKGEEIKVCASGFHACENPFDVLDHYPMFDRSGNESRYCEVEQDGKIDKESDGTKVCSSKIIVKAEIGLKGLINAAVEWIKEVTRVGKVDAEGSLNDNGGNSAQIGSSGDYAQIGSSGDYAKIGSSGDYAKIGSSGYSAKIGSSGYSAKIGSSGYYAKIGSSGYSAKIGSSGYYAKIGSSGDYAQIGSSGDSAQIGSSGDSAKIVSSGEDSVICCAGHGSKVKAKLGSWITLAEWRYDDDKKRAVPVTVKTIQIDGETYLPDTWYILKDGKIVEV